MSERRSPPVCPLCCLALYDPQHVTVCADCHARLEADDHAVSVTETGEFNAFKYETLTAPGTARQDRSRPRRHTGVACTWCGRGEDEVRKILSAGGAHICNGCVALCADVLAAELGDDWR